MERILWTAEATRRPYAPSSHGCSGGAIESLTGEE
jgi:hypothetical protein